MPRIRKLQPGGGMSRKLGECLRLLLSGASGECLAGELGCCGDSCCSSTLVSRALADYCAHSDAAREAFAAAKGIDALQAALLRGSPSAATAAARVLGALCSSPHGLRCVLRWQSSSGFDLLSRLAAVGGGGADLPPELRTECVDALRSALGALHGPAAGGGLELAGALQIPASGAPSGVGALPAADLLTAVALPALLAANAHLRAAAARLVAAAAEEGVLLAAGSGGGDIAAATLTRSLGLTVLRRIATAIGLGGGCSADVGGDPEGSGAPAGLYSGGPPPAIGAAAGIANLDVSESWIKVVGVAASASPAYGYERSGGGEGEGGVAGGPGSGRVSALCELLVSLLDNGSPPCVALLEAMRGPALALQLCGAAIASAEGGGGGIGSIGTADKEALLDAVLLCVRHGPGKQLWAAPNGDSQRERRAFTAGAAGLATQLLAQAAAPAPALGAAIGGGNFASGGCGSLPADCGVVAATYPYISTAAALATALASWPQEVLQHEDLRGPVAGLLNGLSAAVAHIVRPLRGHGGGAAPESGPVANGTPGQAALRWRFVGSGPGSDDAGGDLAGWRYTALPQPGDGGRSRFGGGADSCNAGPDLTALRTAASAAAAAVELYAASDAWPQPIAADSMPDSGAGRLEHLSTNKRGGYEDATAAVAAAAQCMGQLLEATRDCRMAGELLAAPFEALVQLPNCALESLLSAEGTTMPARSCTNESCGCRLPALALAAAGLAEALLAASVGGGAAAAPLNAAGNNRRQDTRAWGASSDDAGSGGVVHGGGWALAGIGSGVSVSPQSCSGGAMVLCSAEQHAALLAALRLWARLLALRPVCTCAPACAAVQAEAGSRLPTAAACVAVAVCEACCARPQSTLDALVEAAEGLLLLQPQQPHADCRRDTRQCWPTVAGDVPHGRSAVVRPADDTSAFAFDNPERSAAHGPSYAWHLPSDTDLHLTEQRCSEISPLMASSTHPRVPSDVNGCWPALNDREAQLLHALSTTLAAAVLPVGSCAVNRTDLGADSLDQIRTRVERVLEQMSSNSSLAEARCAGSQVVTVNMEQSGVRRAGPDGYHDARAYDPLDADRAADLSDADAILDDCLACVSAGIIV